MSESASRLLSRKFLVAMAVIIAASVLAWNRMISDGVYSTIIVATVGAYFTANVAQKKTTNEVKS